MVFSSTFLAEQKERLLAEQQRLEAELSRIATKDPRLAGDYDTRFPDYGRSPEDNVAEEETYEAERGVEHSLELQLRDVLSALRRIADGTYGTCRECRGAIDMPRLQALPAAAACREHA